MSPQHHPDRDSEPPTLAQRAVRRRVSNVEEAAASDVRALMEAGLALMVASGGRGPRVADIVSAAGLSNDAFYRYFGSKDALVEAIVEQGSRTVVSYVRHRIAAAEGPYEQIRAGVAGIMKQASDAGLASSTRAVLGNSTRVATDSTRGTVPFVDELAELFAGPLADIGARDPSRAARTIATMSVASMQYFLFRREVPSEDDMEHLFAFALGGATGSWESGPVD